MSVLMNPDCLDEKHRACSGDGWCDATDQAVPCPCDCHQPAEHYDQCPCGTCQGIRAARPVAAAMQAKHLSGASIGKLVEYEVGLDLSTGERHWSPAATIDGVHHVEGSIEIIINEATGDYNQIGLKPEDWVRITAAAGKVAA